jgi:hypothetical protein
MSIYVSRIHRRDGIGGYEETSAISALCQARRVLDTSGLRQNSIESAEAKVVQTGGSAIGDIIQLRLAQNKNAPFAHNSEAALAIARDLECGTGSRKALSIIPSSRLSLSPAGQPHSL